MKNLKVAELFGEMADILEIKGENPFRVRAYRRAAQNIEGLPKDVADMSKEDLLNIPGIGEDLANKIEEIVKTGALKAYSSLKKDIPPGLTMLLTVPSLGPKTAKLLYDKLRVADIDELENLARGHKLVGLPGIKEKAEENIIKGIETLRRGRERMPLGEVLPLAEGIVSSIKKNAPVKQIAVAGSIRRMKETVRDIDILCTSEYPKKVMDVFVHLLQVREVLAEGPTKSTVVLREGIQMDCRVVEDKSYGAALAYFTGSKAHNIRLREMAVKAGLKLNEYGIFRESDDKRLGGESEEEVYGILGLPFIPPELREDAGEIEAALKGSLPSIVQIKDIKGDLHIHSRWSDGRDGISGLAEVARKLGYEYIAITDHSKGLAIARGLSEEKLLDEIKEIEALNKKLRGFRVLKGIEVDIKTDGTLDLPEEMLRKLDIVIASIHSGFKQPKEKIMKRLTSAMKNPYVSIIGHPTGRLIGEREAYDMDMEILLNTAKMTGTAIEINAFPSRLDLNDIHAKRAKELLVPIAIGTDAHASEQMKFMSYGVSVARRAWLEDGNVLNTLPCETLLKALKQKR